MRISVLIPSVRLFMSNIFSDFTPRPFSCYSCSDNYFVCNPKVEGPETPSLLAVKIIGLFKVHMTSVADKIPQDQLKGDICQIIQSTMENQCALFEATEPLKSYFSDEFQGKENEVSRLITEIDKALISHYDEINDFHFPRVRKPSTPFMDILENYESCIKDLNKLCGNWSSNVGCLYEADDRIMQEKIFLCVLKRSHELCCVFDALEEKLRRKQDSRLTELESFFRFLLDSLVFVFCDMAAKVSGVEIFSDWRQIANEGCMKTKSERIKLYIEKVGELKDSLVQLPSKYSEKSEKFSFEDTWAQLSRGLAEISKLKTRLEKALKSFAQEDACPEYPETGDVYGSKDDFEGHRPSNGRWSRPVDTSSDFSLNSERGDGEPDTFSGSNPMLNASFETVDSEVSWSIFRKELELEQAIRSFEDLNLRLKRIEDTGVFGSCLVKVCQIVEQFFPNIMSHPIDFFKRRFPFDPERAQTLRSQLKEGYRSTWERCSDIKEVRDNLSNYRKITLS